MAWTAPATAVTGDVITAAFWNTNARDNLNYLKGTTGTVTLDNALITGADASNVALYIPAGKAVRLQNATAEKSFDVSAGVFRVMNGAYSVALMSLDDSGNVTFPGYATSGSGANSLRLHRHPYSGDRHIESGVATTSAAGETPVAFTNGFANASAGVVAVIHDSALSGQHRVDVNTVTASGFNVSVKDNVGTRVAAGVFWIAEGPD